MTTLTAEPLSAGSFAPFGTVISRPGRAQDAEGPGWQWWAETHALESDGRRWAFGRLQLAPGELSFDWAECHLRSHEVILASSADLLAYVAPASVDTARIPPQEEFRAFCVPAGDGVELRSGIWHGEPFAVDEESSALVLLLEGTGRDDVTVVRFPESPVIIESAS